MTIIRCPRCRDEVSAPAKASLEAVVRCPLCLEEYPLADALRQVPPELIVVGGAAEDSGSPGEGQASEDAGYTVASAQPRVGRGGVFDASAGTGAAAPARPNLKSSRPRRPERSALGEIIKVVLGGVVGLTLGLLVLWWVFKTDVGDLGPVVARYVPWIVPEALHGKAKSGATATSADATQTAADASPRPKPVSPDNNRPPDSGIPPVSAIPPVSPIPPDSAIPPISSIPPDNALLLDSALLPDSSRPRQASPSAGSAYILRGPPSEPGQLVVGAADPLAPAGGLAVGEGPFVTRRAGATADVSSLDPAAPLPAAEASRKPPAAGAPDLTGLIPSAAPNAPPIPAPAAAQPPSAEDFTQAVIAAGDALARYDNSGSDSREAKQSKFTEMYLAIGEAGRVISHLSAHDAELDGMVKELKSLLEKIAGVGGAPNKTSGVRFLALSHWPQRKNGEGLLVAGVVKELKAAGGHFEITLDAETRGMALSIPVVSANNPQDFCQTGDELVIAGRVIEDPKTRLSGYEGDQARVLLLGYCVKGPKAP